MPQPLAINPGSLRHSVTIQSSSSGMGENGLPSTAWTDVLTTRASISAVSGKELYAAQQVTSQVTHTVTMRWTPITISPGMRILFGDHICQIQTVDNVEERNRVLKLMVLAINDPNN